MEHCFDYYSYNITDGEQGSVSVEAAQMAIEVFLCPPAQPSVLVQMATIQFLCT
jgi:hypothetical protein